MSNRKRKLSQGQKRRHRIQVEQAVQQALLEQDGNHPVHVSIQQVSGKPISQPDLDSIREAISHQIQRGLIVPEQFKSGELVTGTLALQQSSGVLVANWRSGWKWISGWSLAAIGYITVYGVPPELIHAFPEASQSKLTLALVAIGYVGRFINQGSKAKELVNGG